MNGIIFRKFLIIGAICLLILPSIQVALGDNTDNEETYVSNAGETDHFTDCIVIIIGKCNTVTGPDLWKFGFYCALAEQNFEIKASGGEGETLHVLIRNSKFATYFGYENIDIKLEQATGIIFWGGKSILMDNTYIFGRCKAQDAWVTK